MQLGEDWTSLLSLYYQLSGIICKKKKTTRVSKSIAMQKVQRAVCIEILLKISPKRLLAVRLLCLETLLKCKSMILWDALNLWVYNSWMPEQAASSPAGSDLPSQAHKHGTDLHAFARICPY